MGTPMDVRLRLVNLSHDMKNSAVMIFQRNVAETMVEVHLAWKVIRNLGYGSDHSFVYRHQVEVGVTDAEGNSSPRYETRPGDRWAVRQLSGDVLTRNGPARDVREIEIANSLQRGAVDAMLFRCGRPVCRKLNVSPGQKAVFLPQPIIYLAVASDVEEGAAIDAAVLTNSNTRLSLASEIMLRGYASADIIMRGGGGGAAAMPFSFTLSNVNECYPRE